jgi:hypothetical protein
MRSVDGAKSAQRKQHKATDVGDEAGGADVGHLTAHFAWAYVAKRGTGNA